MPDSDRVSIDNLTLAPDLSSNDVAPVVHTVNGVKSTYKATMTLLGTFLNKILEYSADLTTTNKTIIGAINEINAGGGGGGAVILYGTTAPASSLGSDGNLYVKYTAGTGGASDVVDALYAKLDGEWCEISTKQVQSDWSQSDNTKVDYIKNKPTLSTVATSGSYNDLLNKPSIPAAQVNSDWNANSGVAQILNKPTIPTDAEQLPITSGSATNTKDYIDSKTAYASDITSQTTWLNNFDVAAWGYISVLKSGSMVVITFLGLKCSNAINDFTNALQLPSAVNVVYSVLRGGDGTVIPIRTTGQYLQVGTSVVGTTYTGQIVIPI